MLQSPDHRQPEGKAVFAFRKRTSCAEDHLVIEMFRELDEDIWETLANCFQFRSLNHWTEDEDVGYDGQDKERQVDDERVPPNCNAPVDLPPFSKILQQLAGQAVRSRRCPQYGHVPGRQAHDVVFKLREWQIPFFAMDCDVAAAFDHVSHHVITDAWRP